MDLFFFKDKAGEDYLADLIIGQLLTSKNVAKLYTNRLPEYMFWDYPSNIKLYGNGYTVFRKLNPSLKAKIQIINEENLFDFFSAQIADKILYTSVHRRSFPQNHHLADYFGFISKYYDKENIIVIDGEDHTRVIRDLATQTRYYKRELLPSDYDVAEPISFSLPSFQIIPEKIDKEYLLAPCDPRYRPSYKFQTEKEYYNQYLKALFGVTKKKGGWDCMRHYEILACNCLPYFLNIDEKPDTTMNTWPMDLQLEVNSLFESMVKSNIKDYELDKWDTLNTEFKKWLDDEGNSSIYLRLLNG